MTLEELAAAANVTWVELDFEKEWREYLESMGLEEPILEGTVNKIEVVEE